MTLRAACLLLLSWMPLAFAADPALPAYFKLPPGATLNHDSLQVERYGEFEIPVSDDDTQLKAGLHAHGDFVQTKVPDDAEHEALWAPVRTALTAAGWTVVKAWPDSNPASATLRYQKDGKDAWVFVSMFAHDDNRFDLIETAALASSFALKAPAPQPETFGDAVDFPYLAPPPGAKRSGEAGHDTTPLMVYVTGSDEPIAAGSGFQSRFYSVANLSTAEFVQIYHKAFEQAGWTVVSQSYGTHQSDGAIAAHYARGARDIWATLHLGGTDLAINVADVGAENWAKALEKDCRLALYGVNFDFNKATLEVESESVLNKVLDVLKANATLKVEIQGHTDNVGGDDYNQKLSQARAESVQAWLVAHGIAADRLSAKGYGRTQPVADNDSAEGRAKNRRVELRRIDCKK